MKRLLLLALFVPFLYGCSGIRIGRSPNTQRFLSVSLTVKCPNQPAMKGMYIIGSGVIVSDRKILTAAHVVPCPDAEIKAQQPGGTDLDMKIERVSRDLDVARLVLKNVSEGSGRFTVIGTLFIGHVGYGDYVCLVTSFPTRDRRCGFVEGLNFGTIESSPNVEPGNSGSAVYDAQGGLVGIATEQRRARNGFPVGNVAVSFEGREWLLR